MAKVPICPVHKLSSAQCNCFKQSYQIQRTIEELTDGELEMAWWKALRRDEFDTLFCDPKVLRNHLIKLLNRGNL